MMQHRQEGLLLVVAQVLTQCACVCVVSALWLELNVTSDVLNFHTAPHGDV